MTDDKLYRPTANASFTFVISLEIPNSSRNLVFIPINWPIIVLCT